MSSYSYDDREGGEEAREERGEIRRGRERGDGGRRGEGAVNSNMHV